MIEINGKTIAYTLPSSDSLGQVSPYLLLEKLEEEIVMTWPKLKVKKVISSRNQGNHQIYCILPSDFTSEQVRLVKLQIELIAANLLDELKEKIYFAGFAS